MEQDRSQIGNLHIERQKPKLEMEWIKVRVDCSFPRGEIEDFSIFRSHSPGCSHLQMLILFSYLGFTSHFLLFPSPTLPTASEGNCQWRHLDGNFISSLSIAPLPLELWGISTKATQKREWNPKSSSGWVKRGPKRTHIYFAWRILETCFFAFLSLLFRNLEQCDFRFSTSCIFHGGCVLSSILSREALFFCPPHTPDLTRNPKENSFYSSHPKTHLFALGWKRNIFIVYSGASFFGECKKRSPNKEKKWC